MRHSSGDIPRQHSWLTFLSKFVVCFTAIALGGGSAGNATPQSPFADECATAEGTYWNQELTIGPLTAGRTASPDQPGGLSVPDVWACVNAKSVTVEYQDNGTSTCPGFVSIYMGSCGYLEEMASTTQRDPDGKFRLTALLWRGERGEGVQGMVRFGSAAGLNVQTVRIITGSPNDDTLSAQELRPQANPEGCEVVSGQLLLNSTPAGWTWEPIDFAASCAQDDWRTVWYHVPVSPGMTVTADYRTSATGAVSIWTGSWDNWYWFEQACTQVSPGNSQTAASYTAADGEYDVWIELASDDPWQWADLGVCLSPYSPNDEAVTAQELQVLNGGQIVGSSSSKLLHGATASAQTPSCASPTWADVWYRVPVFPNMEITAEYAAQSATSVSITLYTGSNASQLTERACGGSQEVLNYTTAPGETNVWIRVSSEDPEQTGWVRVWGYQHCSEDGTTSDTCSGSERLWGSNEIVGALMSGATPSPGQPGALSVPDVWYNVNAKSVTVEYDDKSTTAPGFIAIYMGGCEYLTVQGSTTQRDADGKFRLTALLWRGERGEGVSGVVRFGSASTATNQSVRIITGCPNDDVLSAQELSPQSNPSGCEVKSGQLLLNSTPSSFTWEPIDFTASCADGDWRTVWYHVPVYPGMTVTADYRTSATGAVSIWTGSWESWYWFETACTLVSPGSSQTAVSYTAGEGEYDVWIELASDDPWQLADLGVCLSPHAPNDEAVNAQELKFWPYGGSVGNSSSQLLLGATPSAQTPSCGSANSPDVWYRVSVLPQTQVTAQFSNHYEDGITVSLWTGPNASQLTEKACRLNSLGSVTYTTGQGEYNVWIRLSSPTPEVYGWLGVWGSQHSSEDGTTSDTCSGAERLWGSPNTFVGPILSGATPSPGQPAGLSVPDVWYEVNARSVTIEYDDKGSTCPGYITIYSGWCDYLSVVGCTTERSPDGKFRVTALVGKGERGEGVQGYVRIGSASTATDQSLRIITGCPNDDLLHAQDLCVQPNPSSCDAVSGQLLLNSTPAGYTWEPVDFNAPCAQSNWRTVWYHVPVYPGMTVAADCSTSASTAVSIWTGDDYSWDWMERACTLVSPGSSQTAVSYTAAAGEYDVWIELASDDPWQWVDLGVCLSVNCSEPGTTRNVCSGAQRLYPGAPALTGALLSGATASPAQPDGLSVPDVWYIMTAPNVRVVYDDKNTSCAGFVAIYTGTCGNLVPQCYTTQRDSDGKFRLTGLPTGANTTYYVRIGSTSTATNQRLRVMCLNAANDEATNAEVIQIASGWDTVGYRSGELLLGATASAQTPSCASASWVDAWYRVPVFPGQTLTAQCWNQNYTTGSVSLWSGPNVSQLTQKTCQLSSPNTWYSTSYTAVAGESNIWIRVSGENPEQNTYLYVSVYQDCEEQGTTKDVCSAAGSIYCGIGPIVGPLTVGATPSPGQPGGLSVPDVWYTLSACKVTVEYDDRSTTASGFLTVYTGSCSHLGCQAYTTTRDADGKFRVTATLGTGEHGEGVQTYIRIGSTSTATDQQLHVTCFDKTYVY